MLFSVALALFSFGVYAAEPPSGLAKLVELAERNSPKIRQSRLALEQAQLEMKTARNKMLPTLDLEAVHGPVMKEPDPDKRITNMSSSTKLVLAESFYDNGASITKYKLASRQVEKKMLEFQQERDDLLKKLAETYYDWSAAWQDRQISDNKRDLLRRQFNVLEAQYKQGLKTKRDVLRIETEVRRLQIDLLHKDNDLEVKLQTLSALVGIPREQLRASGVNAEEAKLDAPIATGPWPELKIEDHRRYRIFKKASEVAEMESRLVERDYWPQVSLAGEVQNKYTDYMDTGKRFDSYEYWQWQALLTIKYNLWDWGERSRNLQVARIKERTVQSTNEQSLLDLGVELRDVWLRLKEFSETVKMTKDLLVIEQQSYNILEAEYRNGRATYLDLITNLNSLIDARSKYATSYFGLKKQQTTYAFHKGTLYDHLKQK